MTLTLGLMGPSGDFQHTFDNVLVRMIRDLGDSIEAVIEKGNEKGQAGK